jgi:hypothetical protein
MRDQAVRTTLKIPADVVARMAGVARHTLMKFEIDPLAVSDPVRRERIAAVYTELRGMHERFTLAAA